MVSTPPRSEATVRCRNCNGNNLQWITDHIPIMVPDPYPLSGDMAVIVCEDCDFVANHSPSTDQDYIRYYTDNNKHYTRNDALHDLDKAYFEDLLDLIAEHGKPDWSKTHVLDWGSGALLFSRLAEERGVPSASNYDMESPFPARPYNLVVSTHCFEHIYDFNAEFARIHALLDENGLFLVAVPDLRGYHDVYWGPYSAFDLEHINHFEIGTLSRALAKAGFEMLTARESERRVTPTLAYPEILVLCRKSDRPVATPDPKSIREAPRTVLAKYFDRANRDLDLMLAAFHGRLADCDAENVAVSPGLYGVASYAFRLLQTLKDQDFSRLDWIADSDTRLSGRHLFGLTIRDANGIDEWFAACNAKGTRPLAFIAAVNAPRIEHFLQARFGDRIDICVLPPRGQNRDM